MEPQNAQVLLPNGKVSLALVGEAVVMADGWYADAVRRFDGGLLLAHGGSWRRDWSQPDPGPWWRASSDGGVSWHPYARPDDGRDHTRGAVPFLAERRDGSVIGWDKAWNAEEAYMGRPGQAAHQSVVRASSWDALVRGYGQRTDSTIWLPYMVPLVGDDLKTLYTPAIWGNMVEVDHGYLIQGVYPVLAYDRAPRLWAEQKGFAPKYRTCVIYSPDDGATWHYLATVASPQEHPLPALSEGYCEPDLVHFGRGRLLCVMRSGGNIGHLMERCTALVACRSSDGGLTWTAPEPIAPYGVAPALLRMRNGLVVCLSGRPGFFLVLSADEGRNWSTPHWVSSSSGAWGRSASGYGQLIELEPGVLGVAYDEYVGEGDGARLVTKFRRYQVQIEAEAPVAQG